MDKALLEKYYSYYLTASDRYDPGSDEAQKAVETAMLIKKEIDKDSNENSKLSKEFLMDLGVKLALGASTLILNYLMFRELMIYEKTGVVTSLAGRSFIKGLRIK